MNDPRDVDRRLLRAAMDALEATQHAGPRSVRADAVITVLEPLIRADERQRICEQIDRSYDHAYDWTPGPRPDGDEWASGYRQRDRQVRAVLTETVRP